jgi:hypothetical protein
LFKDNAPLAPKIGWGRQAVSDIPLQIAVRQRENRFGILQKLLRDQLVLREADLIEHFVRHG